MNKNADWGFYNKHIFSRTFYHDYLYTPGSCLIIMITFCILNFIKDRIFFSLVSFIIDFILTYQNILEDMHIPRIHTTFCTLVIVNIYGL